MSNIEQSIKKKIEDKGTPLSEWDITINYGIKTGFNDAFIITTEKRNELLSLCESSEERERTAAIIRPVLRGRDVKRYSYDWQELWLIWIPWHFPLHLDQSIQGASDFAESCFLKDYPTIYKHLLKYKKQLASRNQSETGIRYEWYAMQRWGANYWEDFDKPKIIFQEIVQESQFVMDNDTHFMCNDTCRIIVGQDLEFLIRILNSDLFFYSIKTFYGGGALGDHGVRMKHTFFCNFPCISHDNQLTSMDDIEAINNRIFELYGLTGEEVLFIKSCL